MRQRAEGTHYTQLAQHTQTQTKETVRKYLRWVGFSLSCTSLASQNRQIQCIFCLSIPLLQEKYQPKTTFNIYRINRFEWVHARRNYALRRRWWRAVADWRFLFLSPLFQPSPVVALLYIYHLICSSALRRWRVVGRRGRNFMGFFSFSFSFLVKTFQSDLCQQLSKITRNRFRAAYIWLLMSVLCAHLTDLPEHEWSGITYTREFTRSHRLTTTTTKMWNIFTFHNITWDFIIV